MPLLPMAASWRARRMDLSAGEAAVRLPIALGRRRDHVVRQVGRRRLLAPTRRLQPVAQRLLVEAGLRASGPIAVQRPEAGAIRSERLVDQDQLTVKLAELE